VCAPSIYLREGMLRQFNIHQVTQLGSAQTSNGSLSNNRRTQTLMKY
jgi:hypothetical protein